MAVVDALMLFQGIYISHSLAFFACPDRYSDPPNENMSFLLSTH